MVVSHVCLTVLPVLIMGTPDTTTHPENWVKQKEEENLTLANPDPLLEFPVCFIPELKQFFLARRAARNP